MPDFNSISALDLFKQRQQSNIADGLLQWGQHKIDTGGMRLNPEEKPFVPPREYGAVVPINSIDALIMANNDAPMNQIVAPNTNGFDPVPLPTELYAEPSLQNTNSVSMYNPRTNTISYRDDVAAFDNPMSQASLAKMHEWRHWRQVNDAAKTGLPHPASPMNNYVTPTSEPGSFERYQDQPIERDARQTADIYARTLASGLLQKYNSLNGKVNNFKLKK